MFVKFAAAFNVLFVCCLFPVLCHAWESNGYQGTADASHVGQNLRLLGSVTSGPACKTLRITAQLANTDGGQISRVALIQSWPGWGSRIIESPGYSVPAKKSGWDVIWISAQCTQY